MRLDPRTNMVLLLAHCGAVVSASRRLFVRRGTLAKVSYVRPCLTAVVRDAAWAERLGPETPTAATIKDHA